MPTRLPPSTENTAAPGTWRLVNLALGISAAVAFVCDATDLPSASQWILGPWYSKSSLETLPAWIAIATRLGLNLWLPASVLMVLFAMTRLPRKLEAPRPRFSATVLAIAWIVYVILTVALYWLGEKFGGTEASGAIGLIVGLALFPVVIALVLGGFAAAISQLAALWPFKPVDPSTRVSHAWLAWALIPPFLLVLPLWFAPSQPLAITTRGDSEFDALCSSAGVRLLAKPAGPVRSIAYDWDPARYRRSNFEYRLDNKGRMNSLGGDPSSYRILSTKKLLHQFDFSESRQDDYCHAKSEPPTQYAHCPSVRSNIELKAPYYGIDAFTADVLAYLDVNTDDYLSHTTNHGPVRFEITLTDRRSGELLGEMSYVVDRANGRACGANVGTIISHEAFYYDAINR